MSDFDSEPLASAPPAFEGPARSPTAAVGAQLQSTLATVEAIRGELRKVFVGQDELLEGLLVGVIADGHVLIESNPGLGKTLLVKGLAKILGLRTNRIQFTPDLMPADITGSHVFNMAERKFEFRPGPVFTEFLLADEINRSPAKTHAAVLEAMAENQVTMDGKRYPIGELFLVVATQNPIESEGTYQLPEAALDRFLLKLHLGYPDRSEEVDIVRHFLGGSSPMAKLESDVRPVTDKAGLLALQAAAGRVRVDSSIVDYLTNLVRATRNHPACFLGASPRAAIALLTASRAMALIRGRNYVVPDDVADLAPAVLRHRVSLTPEAEIENRSTDDVVAEIVRATEVPRT